MAFLRNIVKFKPNVLRRCFCFNDAYNEGPRDESTGRQVYLMRHGERIDHVFGDHWYKNVFDYNGVYVPNDLNMPRLLPKRNSGPESYSKDSPLTTLGEFQARLTGEAARYTTAIHHVFVSPSLRSIQTCHLVLTGLGIQNQLKLNIEPGLFEWLGLYIDAFPNWLTYPELLNAGFNINGEYDPIVTVDELQHSQETMEQYYKRSFCVVQNIIANTMLSGGNVLVVGHAATLDACSRQLIGEEIRSDQEITALVKKIPYCSLVMVEQEDSSEKWQLKESPVPPITHLNNHSFDWTVLIQ